MRTRPTSTVRKKPAPTAGARVGASRRFAIVGAGVAGVACARTLVQAGHEVALFEKTPRCGGRMATLETPFGSFDAGAQYFTVRDARFEQTLATVPGLCRPWSANAVRVLDAAGRVAAASLPTSEPHWVACPGMESLVTAWAQPLTEAGCVHVGQRVVGIEHDSLQARGWQVRTESADGGAQVFAGFDAVLLAQPAEHAAALLRASHLDAGLAAAVADVRTAPCWTLMLAYPQAVRPGLTTLGPQWSAARSTHHRVAWLSRESSKPKRSGVERWTVQASPEWSREHLHDDPDRVKGKLLKAFAEITGIRAEPAYAHAVCWEQAQTLAPLGVSHVWNTAESLGMCGDW
ncbi:MAG: NAD(P)/FAD-dependent oxidoreductase, partial [Giesbergeria sp.]